MKKIEARNYRGVILKPVLGGWIHEVAGYDPTGARFAYPMFTRSLAAAKYAIAIEIKSGRYQAVEGTLTKKES